MNKKDILTYFYRKNSGVFDGNKVKWKYLQNHNIQLFNILKQYFDNIDDSHTVTEILYAIAQDLTEMPTCKVCGKPTHLTRAGGSSKKYFKIFCSDECRFSEKGSHIKLDLYKKSCIEKYGVDNILKVEQYQNKRQQTCLKKYGTKFPLQNKEILLKTFDIEKYDERLKLLQNNQIKHESLFVHRPEYVTKVYNTKKKNKTFNTSKIEQKFSLYLAENNYDYITQYKSKLYPFNCDFYLCNYDLYIELQGSWTHGKHPYDENNVDDKNVLNRWKEKSVTSLYYKNAINTWTVRDVMKIKTAKENKLNYLLIYSNEIVEVIQIFNNYLLKQFKENTV